MRGKCGVIKHKAIMAVVWLLVGGVFTVVSASPPLHAQETWQVDPQRSIARLSQGSGANVLEIGLARVSGDVVFQSSDPADPSVSLKITPDNAPVADYASMSFSSERSRVTSDGKLLVTGKLSVTRIDRSVTMDGNEAYAGPVYGDPVAHTDTREITLAFSDPRQSAKSNGVMQLTGTTSAIREDFPQLLDALTQDPWPTNLVNDEKCEAPSTIGDDYSGFKCTGTEIASVNNRVLPTGSVGGEGYVGFEPTVVPDRNYGAIALYLKLEERDLRTGRSTR